MNKSQSQELMALTTDWQASVKEVNRLKAEGEKLRETLAIAEATATVKLNKIKPHGKVDQTTPERYIGVGLTPEGPITLRFFWRDGETLVSPVRIEG